MNEEYGTQEDLTNSQAGEITPGRIVAARVVAVTRDAVEVDFGYKMEGIIRKADWSDAKIPDLPEVASPDDSIRAMVVELEGDNHPPVLSRRAAVDDEKWRALERDRNEERILDIRLLSQVKGGLVADLDGARAFLPASLTDLHPVNDLSPFVGMTVPAVVTEVDVQARRVILSRKRALEIQGALVREERLQGISPGDRLDGVIARIASFGAFVDLGGVDGLVHVSEMSWDRSARPEDIVSVGDRVSVRVLRVDPGAGKIALTMKREEESPWKAAARQFHVGDIVNGTVKRLSNFGAFVEVAPGVEGLVHVSQIASQRVNHPADVLSPGDAIRAKILEFRPEEERMSLSIREASRGDERQNLSSWKEKPSAGDPGGGVTLGELFGDALRAKFKK